MSEVGLGVPPRVGEVRCIVGGLGPISQKIGLQWLLAGRTFAKGIGTPAAPMSRIYEYLLAFAWYENPRFSAPTRDPQ